MNAGKLVGIHVLLAAATGLAVLATGQSRAAEPEQTTATYEEWTVRCAARAEAPPCDMLQVAISQEDGRQVLRLSLAHLGEGDRIGMQALIPLGVRVSGGVLVQVDGEAVEFEGLGFTRCEPGGCFIEGVVDEASLSAFMRGREGVLAVLDSANRPRGVRLGFAGFTAAFEAMKAKNLAWWAERERKSQ